MDRVERVSGANMVVRHSKELLCSRGVIYACLGLLVACIPGVSGGTRHQGGDSADGEGGSAGAAEGGDDSAGGFGGTAGSPIGGEPSAGGEGGSYHPLEGLGGGEPCAVDGREGVCIDTAECAVPGVAPTPGFCPGAANIQCCTEIPDNACDPNATPFPNVGIGESAGDPGCLPGMVRVDDFCVDRYEAFLVRFGDEAPISPFFNPGDTPVMAMSAPGAVPQGYINEWQAEDACNNAGKRLCTDTEWLRACRGSESTIYPYGDNLEVGRCNDHRDVHPAVEYFQSSEDWIWSELGNSCINQLEHSVAPTGAYEGCETEDGAFDMMGNLHEWTSASAGTFRGGFYADTSINGPGCLYATTAHDVSHWDYSTGFRCCSELMP